MNTLGRIFRLTTFGESHGEAIGGIIDGMPAGLEIDLDKVQAELDRRRPGSSDIVSQRNESDRVKVLSGFLGNCTTGAPIGFIIPNENKRSADYDELKNVYRPSHADFTYQSKYGLRDHRGGGRASARETASWVVAGAFAKQALSALGIAVRAYTSAIGSLSLPEGYDFCGVDWVDNAVRCPDKDLAERMALLIRETREEGDTLGGVVTCIVKGVPAGLGEPVFGKLNAMLGAAMLSINAVKGVEFGMGFDGVSKRGSEVADEFTTDDSGHICTVTNHSGGIQGGISNGADITMRVAFKPVATMMRDTHTVTSDGSPVTIRPQGRHDVCVVPRAVPVVEALAACVILDAWLLNKTTHL